MSTIKTTSVPGRVANASTLSVDGDIGINTYDGRLWVSNGSVVSEIGANLFAGVVLRTNSNAMPFSQSLHQYQMVSKLTLHNRFSLNQ